MVLWAFKNHDLMTVSEALDIAEDATGNFFKFSPSQWKRHRFEVKTQLLLQGDEIIHHAFALLNKASSVVYGYESKTKKRDFYYICLQDHQILKALRRDKDLGLLPLLVYVLTHELVHIVRFCNFFQRFDVSSEERNKEEEIVHTTTFDILRNISNPKLDYVLDSYQGHRVCNLGLS